MQRVTTPTHTFVLDTDPNQWDVFRITYRQGNTTILELTEKDTYILEEKSSGYRLSYTLTQEQTRKFTPGRQAQVQIRAHYPDGKVVASEVFSFMVADVFNQEILGG